MKDGFMAKRLEAIAQKVLKPEELRFFKAVHKLAARQGGSSMLQNYQLLGKRTVLVAGSAVVGVVAVGGIGGVALVRKIKARKAAAEASVAGNGEAGQALAAPVKQSFYLNYGKRACDLAVGLVALPVVGVVTAACGAAIWLEDKGPVFYNAPRVGRHGRMFTMYKLRSMKVNAPDLVMEDGSTYNGADDPRMTRVGAFLRKTSLDEIPQFLNVLKGDMSVVGPRPDLKREVELYQGDESLKLLVKPGVTGYAAVYGRNSLPWHDRLALDVYYVRNLSFPLDVKVFFKTFTAVFNQEGIYVEDAEHDVAEAPREAS